MIIPAFLLLPLSFPILMPNAFPPIYLVGPTGCGKTSVALAVATQLQDRGVPVEIVLADAYQIYDAFPILSSAPTADERALVPHHLCGVIPASEECDAARFAQLAEAAIADVAARACPLVVGGSGLYLKALTHGLAPTPPGDATLRAELELLSLDELVARYQSLDPAGAAATNLLNRRYVTRNVEICLLTGQPASVLKQAWSRPQPDLHAVCLQRERADLYDRINQRTLVMLQNGVLEEVAALGPLSATAAKAIGLSEVRAHLAGEIDLATCTDRWQQGTRRYAKRQETWFRKEPDLRPLDIPAGESAAATATRVIELLATGTPHLSFP
jgi:tRNA dimethylallyltransferase